MAAHRVAHHLTLRLVRQVVQAAVHRVELPAQAVVAVVDNVFRKE